MSHCVGTLCGQIVLMEQLVVASLGSLAIRFWLCLGYVWMMTGHNLTTIIAYVGDYLVVILKILVYDHGPICSYIWAQVCLYH